MNKNYGRFILHLLYQRQWNENTSWQHDQCEQILGEDSLDSKYRPLSSRIDNVCEGRGIEGWICSRAPRPKMRVDFIHHVPVLNQVFQLSNHLVCSTGFNTDRIYRHKTVVVVHIRLLIAWLVVD